jgi:hypothetical protein
MTNTESIEYYLPSDKEIWQAIKSNNLEVLRELCIPLGKVHANWKFAQDVCVELSGHEDEGIRGSALMGLSMVTMCHQKIEKNIVKPVLLRGLKDESEFVRHAANTAVQDINSWMKWRIGQAKVNKKREAKFYERQANR